MLEIFSNKQNKKRLMILSSFLFVLFFFSLGLSHSVKAAGSSGATNIIQSTDLEINREGEIYSLEESFAKCVMSGTPLSQTSSAELAECISNFMKKSDAETKKQIEAYISSMQLKQSLEEAWDKAKDVAKEALAGSWRTMWKQFSKQLVYDTATWIASGGKGQQPLFVTEGWGAYLEQTADEAIGAFIDEVDDRFGVDLCEPDFAVKILITTGVDPRAPRKPRCTFSKMTANWESAIQNADFGYEYVTALRPGENDLSSFLILRSDLNREIDKTAENTLAQLVSTQGWLNLEDLAGNILTPGTAVRKAFDSSYDEAIRSDVGEYTGSVWDIIETFLNTLVGKLLNNLKKGYFSGDSTSGGGANLSNLSALSGLSSLFNSEASPIMSGKAGAEERFSNLVEFDFSIGGPYDILSKLTQCSDSKKTSPGPTDCVIDQLMAQVIRDKMLVKDLPDSIKNREFSPKISDVKSVQTVFTLRNITILRKYRIVPVGWEIAAKYINQYSDKAYTLGDLMSAFNDSASPFYGLVDPNWVLKAPEVFCRRVGYGPESSTGGASGSVTRSNDYCADEQQCLKEDQKTGNCEAFGYCTEEKLIWNFGSDSCDAQYNTCQTYQDRDGNATNWLANSLDYRNCDANSVGCKWYSAAFNSANADWEHAAEETVWTQVSVDTTVTVQDNAAWTVPQWSSTSTNNRIILGTPCAKSGGCLSEFVGASCIIPAGGYKCRAEVSGGCAKGENILSAYNGDFSSCVGWDADNWDEGYQNVNNGHSCVNGAGNPNNALESSSLNNTTEIASVLPDIKIEANKKYTLSFQAKKAASATGSAGVSLYYKDVYGQEVTRGTNLNLGSLSATSWRTYTIDDIDVGNTDKAQIRIITNVGTSGSVYFDNFSLNQVDAGCFTTQAIWLTLGAQSNVTDKEIYFDRDAQSCDAQDGGCSQFIRTKEGLGSNLAVNGGFEGGDAMPMAIVNNASACQASITGEQTHSGVNSFKVQGPSGTGNFCGYRLGQPIKVLKGHRYILSGWIKSSASAYFIFDFERQISGNPNPPRELTTSYEDKTAGSWQRVSTAVFIPIEDYQGYVRIVMEQNNTVGETYTAYYDDIKLEEVTYNVSYPTEYTPYDPAGRPANQLAYLKKAPDYYNCYDVNPGTSEIDWPTSKAELNSVLSSRDPECGDYSEVCLREEVGCELYTPTSGDPSVPGVATSADVCPSECVGYQRYLQEATDFTLERYVQFIANDKAKYCSASYAGCDEFTNLDEVAKGGEGREYYSQLQACQKPIPDGPGDGRTYYTWEGDDTTGYQLKVYELKKSQSGSVAETAPCTNLIYPAGGNGENACADIGSTNGSGTEDDNLFFLLNMATAQLNVVGGVNLNNNLSDYLNYLRNNDPVSSLVLNQGIVDGLHNFGLCAKQELTGYYYNNSETGETISIMPNADCREFYDQSGNIHWRLLSHTVSISDNCHPYRRTMTQADTATAQGDCQYSGGYWNNYNECIYMAVPGEGKPCPQQFVGCRQYSGNRGNNVRNILFSDFEDGAGGWEGGTLSSASSHPGGSSLANSASELRRSVYIGNKKSYVLSFWAKGSGSFNLNSVRFDGASEAADYFAGGTEAPTAAITEEWRRYEFGPVFVTWGNDDNYTSDSLVVSIPSGQTIYLDNVLLKEVKENFYLIENSWFTPYSCDNLIASPYGVDEAGSNLSANNAERDSMGEMLNCAAYTDRAGQLWNLKSFDKLCRLGAVGCEALIDTYNTDSSLAAVYNEGGRSEISVAADETVYLVNDSKYACAAENKGCTAYGLPTVTAYNEVVGYNDVYIKNQPDRYGTDLCKFDSLWCEEYLSSGLRNVSYFKNPRNRICEYNESSGAWFEKGTDKECDVSNLQTVGVSQPRGWYNSYTPYYDFFKQRIDASPSGSFEVTIDNWVRENLEMDSDYSGWAGACPSEESGCSEYIDPLAAIYRNELVNPELTRREDTNGDGEFDEKDQPDGWSVWPATGDPVTFTQVLTLKTNTLYTVSTSNFMGGDNLYWRVRFIDGAGNTTSKGVAVSPDASIRKWIWAEDTNKDGIYKDNELREEMSFVTSGLTLPAPASARFFVPSNDDDFNTFQLELIIKVGQAYKDIKISETGAYYALSQDVDRTTCSGLANYDDGCVLFNERGGMDYSATSSFQSAGNSSLYEVDGGRNSSYLTMDADQTYWNQKSAGGSQSPVLATFAGVKDANSILKVKPDRECSSWLYCNSYKKNSSGSSASMAFDVEQDDCLSVGLCSDMNEKGECLNVVVDDSPLNTVQYDTSSSYKTGYSVVGKDFKDFGVDRKVAGLYPFERMSQYGGATSIGNGDFGSVYSEDGNPLGWTLVNDADGLGWKDYKIRVETDRAYRLDGASYLRVNSVYGAESEMVDVDSDTDYILSGWVNTLDLQPSASSTSNSARAQVLVREYNNEGGAIKTGTYCQVKSGECTLLSDGWQLWNNMQVRANLPWQKVALAFRTSASAASVSIQLINWLDTNSNGVCDDRDNNDICDISGASLFDSIDMKPVLEVGDDDYVARECRLYPKSDSLSCKYVSGGKVYSGWYGYCLTHDPSNSRNCLQWWPVDLLAGETLDEISSSYNERAPLYYCIDKRKTSILVKQTINTSGSGSGQDFSDLIGLVKNLIGNLGESEPIKYTPFESVDSATRIFFRHPSVKFFVPVIGSGGLANMDGLAAYLTTGIMLKDMAFVGGAGITYGGSMGAVIQIPSIQPLSPAQILSSLGDGSWISDTLQSISDRLSDVRDSLCSLPVLRLICNLLNWNADGDITSDSFLGSITGNGLRNALNSAFDSIGSNNSEWGGWGYIMPTLIDGNSGFIVGIPVGWPIASGAAGVGSTAISGYAMNELADQLGGFSSQGMRVITDQDKVYAENFTDPYPDIPGDILGVAYFLESGTLTSMTSIGTIFGFMDVEYCTEVVQVVTPSGKNKAWNARVAQGSSYTLPNRDTGLDDLSARLEDIPIIGNAISWVFDNTINNWVNNILDNFIDNDLDYSADYKPFGSIVPPSDYPADPAYWDSRTLTDSYDSTTSGNQPLYNEAPRTMTYDAPYQARFGYSHRKDDIKEIFAKSYGHWVWKGNQSNGYYKKEPSGNWTIPNDQCDGNVRPADPHSNDAYCYILPRIENVILTGGSSQLADDSSVRFVRNGSVKLGFNIDIDENQLPINSYTVDWGDGSVASVSGVSLRDRASEDYQFELYHHYNYADLVKKDKSSSYIFCGSGDNKYVDAGYGLFDADGDGTVEPAVTNDPRDSVVPKGSCIVKVNISVRDNWRLSKYTANPTNLADKSIQNTYGWVVVKSN